MFDKKKYHKEYMKQYRKDNPKKIKKWQKKWRDNHLEQERERQKKWNKDHPEYRKEYYKRHRGKTFKYIQNYKLNRGCSVCGYNKCAEALCFHHEGDKEFGIGWHPGKNLEEIKNEIEKCEVLCMNCHAELYAREKQEK